MINNFENYSADVPHDLLVRIKSVYASLKTAEKKAADTILNNPKLVTSSTISDLARLAECSDATLVRLARKLGFNGYAELKYFLLDTSDNDNSSLPYEEISQADDAMTVAAKIFKASQQALADTLSLLEKNEYEQALQYILSSKRLFFIGSGDAYTVAYSAYLKFSRIGYNTGCSKDFDIQLIEASKLTSDDVLVIISHSGRTQTLHDIAKFAKARDVKIITITNYPLSPIAKISDVVLLTAVFTENFYNETIAKRIPELCIIETLFINTLMHGDNKHKTIFTNTIKAITLNKI